jgi:flagellar basal-body rod protein FlgC
MSDLFSSLGISGSGMTAERLRMDVIAENLANANTTRTDAGGPYRRKEVVLEDKSGSGASFADVLGGVQVAGVVADPAPSRRVYEPGHPDADAQGFVTLPNVNPVTEMVDLITASRGYEADVQAMNTSKQMFSKAIEVLRS